MKLRTITALVILATSTTTFGAGPAAKVTDLAWMTGTWTGVLGPNTLEENWIAPSNGSIAAMVRMTSANGVGMWEVITVEEEANSLVMHVEQWSKGFAPRTPVQTLELAEIAGQRVKFAAVTEGSVKSLQYSRSADGTFTIDIVNAAGNASKLDLKAK